MKGWHGALFDSCSLITLDKLIQVAPTLERQFPTGLAVINGALEMDRVKPETIVRLKPRIRFVEAVGAAVLSEVLERLKPPLGLSEVDRIVLATAVQNRMAVVTGDKKMALTVRREGGQVWNMALILKEFVQESLVSQTEVERILQELAGLNELLIHGGETTWKALSVYEFPPG